MPKRGKDIDQAVIVGLNTNKNQYHQDEASLDELSLLAETARFSPVKKILNKRKRIDPTYYMGSGNARELRSITANNGINTVIFDFELSPVQIRNLEKLIKCRLITRTELILDIFEKRAKTKEAKLQVELATLEYSLPRLRHMWPHLNRLGGGIGTRGPGEKQLEMDKRRISKRISKIKRDLVSVKNHRKVIRRNRSGKNKVALVGYTNAGKSSLLNTLSHSSLFTERRLFATLDPATREVWLGDGLKALATDTVGFIKRLPHTLIASFRSTLEEVKEADILLHVVDISAPDVNERINAVNGVLREISAHTLPVLYIFNKADLLNGRHIKASFLNRYQNCVLVSARTGQGIDDLKKKLLEYFRDLEAGKGTPFEYSCTRTADSPEYVKVD
ncbi:MAG: GTPase HflX [Spirochaetota bacterium]